MSAWAETKALAARRINYLNARMFSEEAFSFFHREGVHEALLFYTRRIDKALINHMKVYNIHPSLLPAFPGMGSIRKAMHARVDHIGATLHLVDAGLDTGDIVLQTAVAIGSDCTLERAERISFVQKTWLTLRWREMMITGSNSPMQAPLPRALCEAFTRFMENLGCEVISKPDA